MPLGQKRRKHPPRSYQMRDEQRTQTHTGRRWPSLTATTAHAVPQLTALTLLRVVLEAPLLMFRLFHRWLLALSQ